MKVKNLRVQNFRVLRDSTLDAFGGLNVFVGPNATGKSTVLQALNLLLTGSGNITLNQNHVFGRTPGIPIKD